MIDVFLPKERVYIPELEVHGIVTQVRISTYGTEYYVRYVMNGEFYEASLYDFEVKRPITSNV